MSNPTSSTAEASPAPDDSMFSTPSSLTDVVLVVEGKKLHVSQALLCLASPAFLKMFEGDFKNKTEVPIADKKYADFVEFLLCIHPSTCKPVQRETLDIVLPLADEYEVESLKQRCEQFVLNMFQLKDAQRSDPSNVEVVHFLYLSDKYKLNALLDACVIKAKYRTYENGIKTLREFNLLSVDTRFRVLSGRTSLFEETLKAVHMFKQRLDHIVKPECKACKGTECYHSSSGCRVQLKSDLLAYLDKLTSHFRKDPISIKSNVKQAK
ncbi:BTB and MATH domain-containing protein 38-like [Haliotis rubra]|uniref:BTB and MATH domain-containing protein 38-like n=1 Tax=Haliotis rubra TaxID=36100 RepID=UPI001EE51D6B|nr:BTB and MATH domain-containing protein 38-like [Haliotis rubra]